MADDGEVCGACLHRLDSHTPDSSSACSRRQPLSAAEVMGLCQDQLLAIILSSLPAMFDFHGKPLAELASGWLSAGVHPDWITGGTLFGLDDVGAKAVILGLVDHESYVRSRYPCTLSLVSAKMAWNGAAENGRCSSSQWGAAKGGIGRAPAVSFEEGCGWRARCQGSPIAGRRSKSSRMRGLQRAKNARNRRVGAGAHRPAAGNTSWRLHSRR